MPAKQESESTEEKTMAESDQTPQVLEVEAEHLSAKLEQQEDEGGDIELGEDANSRSESTIPAAPGKGAEIAKKSGEYYQKRCGDSALDESNKDDHDDEMCSVGSGELGGNQDIDQHENTGQNPKGLEEVVNRVLGDKLEGFHVQMQNMFAMIQSVAEMSGGGKLGNMKGGCIGEPMDGCEGTGRETEPEDACQTEQKGETQEQPSQRDPQKEELQEFLGTISSILNLPTAQREKSVLDDTVDSEGPPPSPVESLPIEGMVKNCWQELNEKGLPVPSEQQKNLKKKYPLSQEDDSAYGKLPNINMSMWKHVMTLEKQHAQPRTRKARALDTELRQFENIFRLQQRIFSYCSYYLAALGKDTRDDAMEEDTVSKLQKHLVEGLVDACSLSVRGIQGVTRARRRVWLDAMDVRDDVVHTDIVDKPHAEQLFHPDLDATLQRIFPGFGRNQKGEQSPGGGRNTAQQLSKGQANRQQNNSGQGNQRQRNQGQGDQNNRQRQQGQVKGRNRNRGNRRQQNSGGETRENQSSGLTLANGSRAGNSAKRQRQMDGREMDEYDRYSSQSFVGQPSPLGWGVSSSWPTSSPFRYSPSLLARVASTGGGRYAAAGMSTHPGK